VNQPNKVQIKAIKGMIKSGDIPKDSKIITKEHEVYCYLPVTDKEKTIIAVHSSGLITKHINQ
tara:strand:+ start:67 stop:255 length:189 start_codon:yes stop_codon:yes gene_type:complete